MNLSSVLCALAFTLMAAGAGSSMPELMQSSDKVPAAGEAGKATVIDDAQNVVASEIWGSWLEDQELSNQLNASRGGEFAPTSLSFSKNEESAKLICEKLEAAIAIVEADKGSETADALKEALRKIYAAGEMEMTRGERTTKAPFVLVSWRGNPHVFWYRVVRGRDDFESFNIMLARDVKGDGDLMFVGGDFNNSSFRGFKRQPEGEQAD